MPQARLPFRLVVPLRVPSFVDGLARTLDVFGVFDGDVNEYLRERDPFAVDRGALESDVRKVGSDMWTAMRRLA